MHKHFRMLAIHDYMTSQGVINPSDNHTKIPGIWEKLASLYNLPILDEREDSVVNDLPDENGEVVEVYCLFSLPEDEYGAKMFARRLDPEASRSPEDGASRHESTVADTDEPGSSPAPGRRSWRKARTPARGCKGVEVAAMKLTAVGGRARQHRSMGMRRWKIYRRNADGGESEEEGAMSGEEDEPGTARIKRRKIAPGKGSIGRGSARRSARKK